MTYPVENLDPKLVWKYFGKICQIPHGSKNETAIANAVVSWAKEQDCEADIDENLNVVIRIKASPGHEDAPIVVLQGHLDMVCEKNSDKKFDFEKDAIVLLEKDGWITADGTTLGADNGVGLAMGLAYMEMPDAIHGPLEILCTSDEETGLHGANSLKPDFVKGKMLLNLDSEEIGIFYVGCSGGRDTNISLPVTKESATGTTFKVEVKGLRGGHSGLDIIKNRGNALRILARTLNAASAATSINLVDLTGGDKHNAIPREANALIQIDANKKADIEKIFEQCLTGYQTEFATAEPDLSLSIYQTDAATDMLTEDSTKEALALTMAIPHGIQAMSRDLKGMVESSSNMARIRIENGEMTILTSSRSACRSAVNGIIDQIVSICELAGANISVSQGYPGWQPNMKSELLAKAKEAWIEKYGESPEFTAIHAGLECGIIGEKYPGMDMISFGPTIENPHSPDERVNIDTVKTCFEFLTSFLKTLSQR